MALEAITAVFYLFILLVITGVIGLIVFWVLMIIDCAKRNFERPNEQIVWILVLVFTGLLGATIYYFVIKRKDKVKSQK